MKIRISKILSFSLLLASLLIFNIGKAEAQLPIISTYFPSYFTSYSYIHTYSINSFWSVLPQMMLSLPMQDNPELNTEKKDSTNKRPLMEYERPSLAPDIDLRRNPDDEYNFGSRYQTHPQGYEKILEVDSTGTRLRSRELVDSLDIGYQYDLDVDEYLDGRKKRIQGEVWDSLLTKHDMKKALSGGDIARLLGQATGVSIPLPPNPVMSIFGKPEISINVNGEVNMRMGVRWDIQNLGTVSAFGQKQVTPMFNQDIRLNISGGIGDKLKIGTDWNTRRTFDYDNSFKIGYEGYDDDIVKLVEVGNVSLPLESQLISGGQALFGVRADFQFGPLFLKTIYSQRRGQQKAVNVRGGASKSYFQLRAYDYARNHFFIDTIYKEVYKKYFEPSTPVIPNGYSHIRIKEIEVWESSNDVREVMSADATAYAELEPKRMMATPPEFYDPSLKFQDIQAGEVERGNFNLLDTTRYRVNLNLGTLTIYNLREDRTYAVAYRVEGPTPDPSDDIYYGTLKGGTNTKDTLILKLLYRPNFQPQFEKIWPLQMKNIYQINATNVNTADTKIGVWYINQSNDSTDVLEGAKDKLVTILRVDQTNNGTGSSPPDGQWDMQPPFFDAQYGELVFPHPEPFKTDMLEYFEKIGNPDLAQQYMFEEIYDSIYDKARRITSKDRFIISGEVSGSSGNRIILGAFNLAPGSVKVTLNGRVLREYEDYVVDYISGILTLRNQQASLPNANLKIEYEQHDVFNISTRTLTGIRADYNLFSNRKMNANLGFTLMHYDQSAVIDRVRIGDEPVSNTMLGFDAKFDWDTPWLTRLLDKLPFYDTKASSSITLRGEAAVILPEPNKRKSDVASDNGAPVVYIDDFEGAQRYITLGQNPNQWSHASQPVDSLIAVHDTITAKYRGKMYWWQYFLPRVSIKEVWPNRSTTYDKQKIAPLQIVFDPEMRGIYNKNAEFLDTLNPEFNANDKFWERPGNKEKIWGGMQRLFSSFNTNFDTENIEYIEIMMQLADRVPDETKMYIDIGQVSEDVIPNGSRDSEDGSTVANPLPNNIIDLGEDTGLDTWKKEVEQENYPYPLSLEDDPARDDYNFNFSKDDNKRTFLDFMNYNNYEGNARQSELGQFPDTEILNKNNGQTLSDDESYFRYELITDPNPETNTQIVGGSDNGWRLWRIPIRKPTSVVGRPSFSNIQYIRVWFKGGRVKANIADWRLVGSHWQRIHEFQDVAPNDSVMKISFVNREENTGAPDYYTLPAGVRPPIDRSNLDPERIIYQNEQSLAIGVKNLRFGEERMAARIFREMDIFNYKKMKFFIHGDNTMPDNMVLGATPKAYAFLRFGIDSNNYYEYRRPLIRGWQDLEIDLEELTAIKQERDTGNVFERQMFRVQGDELAAFAIKGNPILTKIRFFGFGISNPKERFPNELTTTMWVNELRLIEPEASVHGAAIASFDMKLADLASINASVSMKQPNFHGLDERFGDRNNSLNWSVNMNGNLEKFAPKSFKQMKVPITYSHSEFMETPEFVANNDINLEEAAKRIESDTTIAENDRKRLANEFRRRSETMRIQDSWALSGVKLGIPVKHWLVDKTINNITFGYSYSQEFERSPVVANRFMWMWKMNAQYSLNLPKLLDLEPLTWANETPLLNTYSGLKINLLPQNINLAVDMQRRRITEQSRFLPVPSPVIRDFSANRTGQFSWKFAENGFLNPILDYNVNTISTLVPYEFDQMGNQRTGSEIAKALFFNNGAFMNFGRNNMHNQNVKLSFTPRIPNIASIGDYLDMKGQFETGYTWSNPLQEDPDIHDIAKRAGFNNTIQFSTGFRLKTLADKWFGMSAGFPGVKKDTSKKSSSGIFGTMGSIFKTIFLDYEKIDFTIRQNNSSVNPGVMGGTGMNNFWGRGMTFRGSQSIYGPSLPYQLGLISNPHGSFGLTGSSAFPFFGFTTDPGLRPPNATLQDVFDQQTQFNITTTRPLWEDATLDLNWSTTVGYNRQQTVTTDEFGNPTFSNIIAMKSLNRTYLAFPSIFGLDLFGSNIENVVDTYNQRAAEIDAEEDNEVVANQRKQNALAEAFHDELEAFSIFGGEVGKFLPAVNWNLRWEGLEKFALWKDYTQRITFEHAYQSQYQENARINDNGRIVEAQSLQYGFQPLIGMTFGFDEKALGGMLTATFRWNSTTQLNLQGSNRSIIQRQATEELSLQASYTLKQWEFPFLGFTFENDLEFSFTGSFKSNKRATYDISDKESYEGEDNNGRKLDGNTQITIEPRIRYSMSQRLTASFFVRYDGTFTEGASTPGFSTVQVGFDFRLSLSGGR